MNFDIIRPMFGGHLTQSQVDGINAIQAGSATLPINHQAYLLATPFWETSQKMQAVRETLAVNDDLAISRLDYAWENGKLPWVSVPYWRRDADGKAWFGRGLAQITHKENYKRLSPIAGVDLVADPSLALTLSVAVKILVGGSEGGLFSGHKLSDYLTPEHSDYVGARHVINGSNEAQRIAEFAVTFEKALRAA